MEGWNDACSKMTNVGKVYTRRYLGHCDVERRIILKLTLHN
jgi:hypothetical protein